MPEVGKMEKVKKIQDDSVRLKCAQDEGWNANLSCEQ